MSPRTHPLSKILPGTVGSAASVDHTGPVRDPDRVTIMQLARRNEIYKIRWRENLRHDGGTITRKRRSESGGTGNLRSRSGYRGV